MNSSCLYELKTKTKTKYFILTLLIGKPLLHNQLPAITMDGWRSIKLNITSAA